MWDGRDSFEPMHLLKSNTSTLTERVHCVSAQKPSIVTNRPWSVIDEDAKVTRGFTPMGQILLQILYGMSQFIFLHS